MVDTASRDTQIYTPHLKKVLKTYQLSAMNSLSGPNGYLGSWPSTKPPELSPKCLPVKKKFTTPRPAPNDYDPFLAPPPFPIQQIPILTAPDQTRSKLTETILEGEVISCFIVGGEKRLCLPQVLNSVLQAFTVNQINITCDELQIFCSTCNSEQIKLLKTTGILPYSAPSCGLITKSDAERLCNSLLHPVQAGSQVFSSKEKEKDVIEVYHECFGTCRGLYSSDKYSSPAALCIQCTECGEHFSPQKFVCHTHKMLENRTCHWGFDSINWRAYLLLVDEDVEEMKKKLKEMKSRYSDDYSSNYNKRKQYTAEERDLGKKLKYGEALPINGYIPYTYETMSPYSYPSTGSPWARTTAFRPWSPVLSKDGKPMIPADFTKENLSRPDHPILVRRSPAMFNPDRLVLIPKTEKFDCQYQPNVSLVSIKQESNKSPDTNTKIHEPVEDKVVPTDTDLSTDTEETLSESISSHESNDWQEPNSSSSEKHLPEEANKVDEIESVRKLMEANNMGADVKQEIIKKLGKLVNKCKNEVQVAQNERNALQKELHYVKLSKREKLKQVIEAKHHLKKQLLQEREEHSLQMKEQLLVQEQLRTQLATALSIGKEDCRKDVRYNDFPQPFQTEVVHRGKIKEFAIQVRM